eukprot:5386381-Amphidinium_carterae.2
MACGDIVWAMSPSPPRSNCLACENLLHLALRHRQRIPVCEGSSARGELAKFWLESSCAVRFGIAVEQLAMSSGCSCRQCRKQMQPKRKHSSETWKQYNSK